MNLPIYYWYTPYAAWSPKDNGYIASVFRHTFISGRETEKLEWCNVDIIFGSKGDALKAAQKYIDSLEDIELS